MRRSLLLIAPALLAAAPPSRPPPATAAGAATDCVRTSAIRETRVRDDRTIDFVMNDRTVYRNALPASCPDLGFEQAFGYATTIGQLCSVDIIHVLHRGVPAVPGASCGLGRFQPVILADPKR